MDQQQITSMNAYDVISRMMFSGLMFIGFLFLNFIFIGFLCRMYNHIWVAYLFLVFGSIILPVKSNAENVTIRHLNSLIKEKASYEIVVLLASEDVFPNFKHGIECNEIE
ncbi:hypothetical protein ACWXWI_07155 [Pantoea ananatis]